MVMIMMMMMMIGSLSNYEDDENGEKKQLFLYLRKITAFQVHYAF